MHVKYTLSSVQSVLCLKGKYILKIKLGEGIGPIQFGITKDKAVEILGAPDKVFETDEECERLQFNDNLIELSFEPDNDGLLGWIEVHNPNAKLFGLKLLGMNKSDVVRLLGDYLKYRQEIDDYGSMVSLSYDEHWLELQFKIKQDTPI